MSYGRYDNVESLVQRMADGLGSNRYKAVDYDRLKATLSEKRFGSIKTSMKVAKIEQLSQQHRENTILKQHQLVWHKEFLRLQHLRKKAQSEVETHLRCNRDSDICHQIYNDFDYCEAGLSTEFDAFKKATADPVWNLRDDLRYWLTENREELKLGSPDILEKHNEIRSTIQNVNTQQEEIMQKLYHEQKCLEEELRSDALLELCPPTLEKHTVVVGGIPEEALELECPDSKLRAQVLREFITLDERYENLITELEDRHALALSCNHCGGWDEDEHFEFVAIHDQYPRELPNRRTLLFNRLKRHLPKKSRANLSDHEDWWMDYKYYHERLKGIYSDWARDRKELLAKTKTVFAEMTLAHELEEVRSEYCERQRQICDMLAEKVEDWRKKKEEAMQIQAKLNEERQKLLEEKIALEKEAEQKKRKKDKELIEKYKTEKEEKIKEIEAEAEARLKQLHEEMAEQAIYDKERIEYREKQLLEKLDDRARVKQEKVKEDEEKEARLERLREQVRVIAEVDPERTKQGTKAWEAHHKEEDDEESPMLKPLFEVHGYLSKQITSDPRVKLENRLREAGLHTSDYARTLLKNVQPPTVPRKDLKHTFQFKQE